jgi:hypothetical protein
MPSAPGKLIELIDIGKRYDAAGDAAPVPVLQNVSLQIACGE